MTDAPRTALFESIRAGRTERTAELLAERPELAGACADADETPSGDERWTPLHAAVHWDRPEALELLLAAGADPDVRNAEGRTAAHDAFEDGRPSLRRLLAAGAEVDAALAAALGDLPRLRALLDRDPLLAEDDTTGLNPLGWASWGDQPDAVRELVAHGARLEGHELLCAASCGHAAVSRVLLELGADPEGGHVHWPGQPIHMAVRMPFCCDSSELVSLLIEAGADPNARDVDDRTPLDLARAGVEHEAREHAAAAPSERERLDQERERLDPECQRLDPECKRFDRVAAVLRRAGGRTS